MPWRKPALAVAVVALAGCATPEADKLDLQMRLDRRIEAVGVFLREAQAMEPGEQEGLLVQLAFGAEADLDLYVTDPQLETVYFANQKSKSGGRISADRRCDGDAFQIEEVRFDVPKPGRYRVGIDYPESCDGADVPAARVVSVFYKGKRLEGRGTVSLKKFEVIVLEFEIDVMEMKEVPK